jgi:uncharacterized protein
MDIDYCPKKRLSNLEKHGLDFEHVYLLFEANQKIILIDTRKDYGEERKNIYAKVKESYYVASFTERNEKIRVISFRRCREREIKGIL